MAKKPKTGRPSLPAADKRSIILQMRLTAAEQAVLKRAAKGDDLSTWARRILLSEAAK